MNVDCSYANKHNNTSFEFTVRIAIYCYKGNHYLLKFTYAKTNCRNNFLHLTQLKNPEERTNLKDCNHSMPTRRTVRHGDNWCTNVNRRDLASCNGITLCTHKNKKEQKQWTKNHKSFHKLINKNALWATYNAAAPEKSETQWVKSKWVIIYSTTEHFGCLDIQHT